MQVSTVLLELLVALKNKTVFRHELHGAQLNALTAGGLLQRKICVIQATSPLGGAMTT